jgi:hypothetical protein
MPTQQHAARHHRNRSPGLVDPQASISVSLLRGLTHYYSLEEASGGRADQAGASPLIPNVPTSNAAGILGNGALFVGASLQTLSSATLMSLGADHGLSLWFKPTVTGLDGFQRGLFSCGDSDNDNQPMIFIGVSLNGLTAKSGMFDGGYHIGATTLVAGNWYHLVWTKTAAGVALYYLNGVVEQSYTQADVQHNTQSYVGSGYDHHFDGVIDEVGVWDRVLSSADVLALYNGGLGKAYPF